MSIRGEFSTEMWNISVQVIIRGQFYLLNYDLKITLTITFGCLKVSFKILSLWWNLFNSSKKCANFQLHAFLYAGKSDLGICPSRWLKYNKWGVQYYEKVNAYKDIHEASLQMEHEYEIGQHQGLQYCLVVLTAVHNAIVCLFTYKVHTVYLLLAKIFLWRNKYLATSKIKSRLWESAFMEFAVYSGVLQRH